MTQGGWIIMIGSVGFVTGLLGWCIWKVLTTPGAEERVHGQANIDPPDVE